MYPKECIDKPLFVAPHGNPRSSFIARREALPESIPPEARQAFLFVGNRDGYKAFDVAVEAFALSRLWNDGRQLLCTGPAFSPGERKMLEKRRVNGFVRWTGPLDTHALFNLYAKSLGLLYPSSYEGFGLPILEAMTFGCIPLVANLDPMRSIVGGVLPAFSPGDAYGLRDLMLNIASPNRAGELASRVAERANDFQWSRSIDLHLELYRNLGAEVLGSTRTGRA
jgi:glycosyltransferase involved in cell wall biosynthesis